MLDSWSESDLTTLRRLELQSDETLAQSAAQGEEQALAVLMRRYKPLILVKIAPHRGSVRDEALLAAWDGLYWAIRRFPQAQGRSFGEWAAYCMNERLAEFASVPVEIEEAASVDDPTEPVSEDDMLANLPDAVRASLDESLSALEREVFARYNKGNSYQEIADALKRPLKSIDNALYRIKCKLEAAVQRHSQGK